MLFFCNLNEKNNVTKIVKNKIPINGKGETKSAIMYPVAYAKIPPIITCIVAPKPDALPANLGLTETIPAAAFGTIRPWPKPTRNIGVKKLMGPKVKFK